MELLRIIGECAAAGGGDCALATVVETNGSTYRRAGARLIVRRDRKMWGAISGGCLEADIAERARTVIECNEATLAWYRPAEDDVIVGLGTGCNGELAVLIEPFAESMRARLQQELESSTSDHALITTWRGSKLGTRVGLASAAPDDAFVQAIVPRLTLFLFGASPAAEPMLRIAKSLGWCVRIADHRPFVANDERFASADSIDIAHTEDLPSRFSYPVPSAAVVMTHHYLRDVELLRQLAPLRLTYLGVVGSRDRARRLIDEAGALGADGDWLSASLRAPAGLDLGADAPSEIALSIIAEIQAVLRGTLATPLRDKRGRIHPQEMTLAGEASPTRT